MSEVDYLGHKIDAIWIHPLADRVESIRNAKVPENVTESRQLLGLTRALLRLERTMNLCVTRGREGGWVGGREGGREGRGGEGRVGGREGGRGGMNVIHILIGHNI